MSDAVYIFEAASKQYRRGNDDGAAAVSGNNDF
jgi:hypothetical protein